MIIPQLIILHIPATVVVASMRGSDIQFFFGCPTLNYVSQRAVDQVTDLGRLLTSTGLKLFGPLFIPLVYVRSIEYCQYV